MTETIKQLLIGALLYELLYGEITDGDIKVAQHIQSEYAIEDLPQWLHTIAGGIGESRDGMVEWAKKELAIELSGADKEIFDE